MFHSRRAVQKIIDQEYERQRSNLKELLSDAETVSITMDIWSDNTMRGFMGLTVHLIGKGKLMTRVVDVPRFKGNPFTTLLSTNLQTSLLISSLNNSLWKLLKSCELYLLS